MNMNMYLAKEDKSGVMRFMVCTNTAVTICAQKQRFGNDFVNSLQECGTVV